MAFNANTGEYKVTRSDIFLVDPRALIVDWGKNLSRNGEQPPVDEALIELARDMMPKVGQGADGSSGQINPITVRPLSDRQLEVVGGFRRMRAALYLIESGLCADFKIKYTVSRLSDAEAALHNLSENLQREDPKPVQLAYAIRSLIEDYGMTVKEVAGRLKRSVTHITNLLNLVTLLPSIQTSVNEGQMPVAAALELARLPKEQQATVYEAVKAEAAGGKISTDQVRDQKRETNVGQPVARNVKQVRAFLELKSCPTAPGHHLAQAMLDWLAGQGADRELSQVWDEMFAEIEDGMLV